MLRRSTISVLYTYQCKILNAAFPELKGFNIGLKRYGYLILDMQNDSMPRVKMQNRDSAIMSEYLTPEQLKDRFPYLNVDGVKSASFHKLDGIAEPAKLLEIYEKGAKGKGVGKDVRVRS